MNFSNSSNPVGEIYTGSTTIAFEMDKSGNADFSFFNPSGTERILLNAVAIHSSFTATHIYEMASNESLEPGDAVKLVNRELVKCTTEKDKSCIGLFTGELVSTSDPLEPTPENPKRTLIRDSFGTVYEHSLGGPHTLYAIAAGGDSFTDDLPGAKVCNENGAVLAGDLLCTSSTKPGFLMKQLDGLVDDDIIRSYTVAQAIEDVVFDENGEATGVYVYLKK